MSARGMGMGGGVAGGNVPVPFPAYPTSSTRNVGGGVGNLNLWNVVDVGTLLAQTNPATLKQASTPSGPQQQTVAGENSLIRLIYGTRRVGAQVAGVVTYSQFAGTSDLLLICVWGLGPVDAIEAVEINDAAVPAGVTVTDYLGTTTQVADATLIAAYAAAGKTFADAMPGVCYSVVRVPAAAAINGFPRCAARIRGMKVTHIANAYVTLNGTSQYVSTPTSAQQVINEDFEAEAYLSLSDWTPAVDSVIVSKWDAGTTQRGYRFLVKTTGALSLEVSTNGTAVTTFTSSAVPAHVNAIAYFVKAAFKKTNGANSEVKFYISTDAVVWAQLGATQTAAIIANIHASTFPVRVGADGGGAFLAGNVYYVKLDTPTKRVIEFLPWDETASLATWQGPATEVWTGQAGAVIAPTMLAYADIPGLVLADFLRSRTYGLGKRVDFKTCLQLYFLNALPMGTPPEQRHMMALALDTSQPGETWREVLRDYAHCWAVEEDGIYYLIRDANDGVEAAFTASNTIENSFRWQKRGARNQPTCIEVTYTDTTQSPWRDNVLTEYLPGVLAGSVPRRMSRLAKQGINRYSEARRYAIERLNDATLSDVSVIFRVDDSAINLRVGALINVTHPIGFAVKPFRVLRCDPVEAGRWQISAAEFDPGLYSTVVQTTPTFVDTALPSPGAPPALVGLVALEDLVQQKDGLYISRIRLDWTATTYPFVGRYRVEIFEGGVGGVLVDTADISVKPYVTPPLKELVLYTARVTIISTTGSTGTAAIATLTPQGKFLPPGDVPSITGFEAGGRVFLAWGVAIDLSLDTIRYEIRYGPTSAVWDTAAIIERVSALTLGTPGFPTGTYRFFVKALDSVGMYSTNAAFCDVVVSLDGASFSAYTYINQPAELFAMTESQIGAARIATTDWGDAMGYGHLTLLNTTGLWNDATVAGSVVGTQPHRSGLMFSTAASRYVTVPYVAAHNVGVNFTFEAWIYPLLRIAEMGIFAADTSGGAGGWHVSLSATGQLQLVGVGSTIAASSNIVPLFKWSHVRVKVTASVAALYINGAVVSYATGPNAYTYTNSTSQRLIGAAPGAVFTGIILRSKLWNTALSDANVALSMQYDNDATAIGGMVGCWKGSDQLELATSTVYADSGTGASNGTVTPSADWRSWSDVTSAAIDLGQIINGTFTVAGGSPTSLNGVVGPVIELSTDGVTYTAYKQPTIVASARFMKFGYEAQGGSMSVDLATMRGDVLVTPRVETATIAAQAASVATVLLSGLYARCIDLQLTFAGGTTGTPSSWFAVPDRIEVGSKGITGGVWVSRLCDAAGLPIGRYSRNSFALGAAVTIEMWVQRRLESGFSVFFDFPNTANPALNRLVCNTVASGNNMYMEGNVSGVTNFDAGGGVIVKGPRVTDGWVHIALVINGTAASLYYDGVLKGTATVGSPANASTARTWALGSLTGGSPLFEGWMYDVRVWDEARTPAQILAGYKSRAATGGNLKAYWKLDNDALDSSGNSFTLTPAGTVAYRPLNGYDVYLFDAAAARQTGDVRCRWTGA